jgi:hypothetical protein
VRDEWVREHFDLDVEEIHERYGTRTQASAQARVLVFRNWLANEDLVEPGPLADLSGQGSAQVLGHRLAQEVAYT